MTFKIVIIIGPTSIGKTSWAHELAKKYGRKVIDIDDVYNKYQTDYRLKWLQNNKWNFNKFKRNYVEYLENTIIPKIIESSSKKIILPHIYVPDKWKEYDPKVIVGFRDINDSLKLLKKRKDARSISQLIKDYKKYYIRSLSKTKFIMRALKPDRFGFNKFFGLEDQPYVYITSRSGVQMINMPVI
jgi:midasin (ATPase involved in ribosome maturation)